MNTPRPEARERGERLRSVFLEALATDPSGRGSVLDRTCGDDPELRREVEGLVQAGTGADEFLSDLARRARAPFVTFRPQTVPEGRLLGAYRVVRELGRGGMGAVYLAERADERYHRQVAIKLLPLGLGSAAAHERFLAERRMLAGLDHPGIARLLDAGVTEDGTPYFIMEYVEGEPITSYCDRRACSIEDRLALFLQVCEAVEYAHRHHVVHRDLKPANILVTTEGRTKLLDFGIAKLLDSDAEGMSTLTQWGGSPFTPSVASPEQVAGETVGFASDVYQLGVLLYHLLAGCPPYSVAHLTPTAVRRVIMAEVPAPPSEAAGTAGEPGGAVGAPEAARLRDSDPATLRGRLRGDLDTIALKALRKEPARRYPSVSAFAADVVRHLDGRRVLARREGRFARARRGLVGSAGFAAGLGAAAVLALAGSYALWFPGPSASRDSNSAPAAAGQPDLSAFGSTSTRSLVAYRFYQEGVRAYYRGAASLAYPLFGAAVREDSTFAMAWLYLGQTAPEDRDGYSYFDRARQMAEAFSSERERLLVGALWAEKTDDRSLAEIADTLTSRYPDEVDGHLLLGVAHGRRGEFLAALPYFERVVYMDSASLVEGDGPCRACDALGRMVRAYVEADSLAAAERTARRWVRLQPGSATAWQQLAWTLWRQERGEEAIAARREAAQRRAATGADQIYPAVMAIRLGNYADADVLLEERIRNGTREVRQNALWWQTISFRYQGRLREALESATQHRELVDTGALEPADWHHVSLQAQVLFEMGRVRESGALMDSAQAVPFGGLSTSRDARHRLWILTHASTVAMAAGDTAHARMLADTIEALAEKSDLARDQLLPEYVRGMLLAHEGDREGAIGAFRRAIATNEFARGNLELARLLVDMDQGEEAVAVLHPALRGPIAAHGFYVTRPDLHALLGRAWDAAGRPDSAAVNYRKALAAWERADPEFRERTEDVRRRLAVLPH